MAHPLYLTATEKILFEKLPEALREGWEVKEEKGKYKDDEKKRVLRATFSNIQTPALRDLGEKVKTSNSSDFILHLVRTLDISKVSTNDLTEMFFVLGPDGMALMLNELLSQANTDEDLNAASFVSDIRHTFFTSAVPA